MAAGAPARPATPPRTLTWARPWLPPVILAGLLAAYNNLIFALPGDLAFPDAWAFYPRAVLLPLFAVVWAVRTQGLSLSEIGITARNLLPGIAWGLGAAAAVALPAVLYFLFPIGVAGGSIDYDRPTYDSLGDFLFWAGVRYPVNAALFEEVLFRGVLLALAVRALGLMRGTTLTASSFAAWHIVVNYTTMNDTNVADNAAFFLLAQVGAFLALFVGGLLLAALRRRHGSLTGPIAFHWAAVVAMNAALYAQAD